MTKTYKVGITNYFQHIPNTIVYTTFCDTYVLFVTHNGSNFIEISKSFQIVSEKKPNVRQLNQKSKA